MAVAMAAGVMVGVLVGALRRLSVVVTVAAVGCIVARGTVPPVSPDGTEIFAAAPSTARSRLMLVPDARVSKKPYCAPEFFKSKVRTVWRSGGTYAPRGHRKAELSASGTANWIDRVGGRASPSQCCLERGSLFVCVLLLVFCVSNDVFFVC